MYMGEVLFTGVCTWRACRFNRFRIICPKAKRVDRTRGGV